LGAVALAIPTVRFSPESKERGVRVLKLAAERIRRRYSDASSIPGST